jgi:arsenate reductase-like glutaredoxin family protein
MHNLTERPIILPDKNLTVGRQGKNTQARDLVRVKTVVAK